MLLPEFLVVGAMKAGTTSLGDCLQQIPDIYMHPKELHFFDNADNYSRGLAWYSAQFADGKQVSMVGEKTPTYSYMPEVAVRIREAIPDVKLVWIFRDPVKRTYSNYWHAVRQGVEYLPFEQAVAREPERIKQNLFYGYIARSRYIEQVEHYLTFFPEEQMFYMLFEDLLRDVPREMQRLCSFLNISHHDEIELKKLNSTEYYPRSWFVQRLLCQLNQERFLARVIRKLNNTADKPKLDRHLRDELRAHFIPYNERLASATGLDLSVWQ